jgi:hypothetical protein
MRIEHWVYELPLRLRSLFRRGRVEQDLDEEIQYHLDRKIEEFVGQGLTHAQARLAALRAMDGLTQHKEECRDMRRVNMIHDLGQDVRYGVRVLAKSPGFTAVAVTTLALAIGANAVVFGVLNAVILRPLNVPRAESLYLIQRGKDRATTNSYPDYLDLRDRNRSFDGLAAVDIAESTRETVLRPRGRIRRAGITSTCSAFGRTWGGSFTSRMNTGRTALRTSCWRTGIGKTGSAETRGWWGGRCRSTSTRSRSSAWRRRSSAGRCFSCPRISSRRW